MINVAQAHNVLAMIRQDIKDDVHRFEGVLFSGPNVSQWLGNLSASVSAIAGIVDQLVDDNRGEKEAQ